MPFQKLCGSDPLLDFIRKTYDAIPLRVPDKRVEPLCLFTTVSKRVRLIGTLSQLHRADWVSPPVLSAEIAALSRQSTNALSWSILTDLLGPLLKQMVSGTQMDITASLRGSRARNDRVRLVLGGTKRLFVDPLVCAAELQNHPVKLPKLLDEGVGNSDSKPLYITDAILTAKQITISDDDDSSGEFAVKLESDLAGKVAPELLARRKAGLTITARERFPFAFTCLKLLVNEHREVTGLMVHGSPQFLGATEAATIPVSHSVLGDPDQLVFFDD
jgi:hypothetical protein